MAFSQAGGASGDMLAKSAALMQKYRTSSTAPNVFRMGGPGQVNAEFPVQLSTTDPEDQKWATMQKVVGNNARGVIEGVGQNIVPPEFWDYVQRKENADLLAQFQQFVLQQVDLSKPESANWWFTRFPWIRDLKLKEIDEQAELQKRFAQIQVTGPQNEDDFLLIWMRKNKLIRVADQPLDKLNEADNIISGTYKEGFFSPLSKKIPATQPTLSRGNRLKWSNPIGPANTRTYAPFRITGFPEQGGNLSDLWHPTG